MTWRREDECLAFRIGVKFDHSSNDINVVPLGTQRYLGRVKPATMQASRAHFERVVHRLLFYFAKLAEVCIRYGRNASAPLATGEKYLQPYKTASSEHTVVAIN